MPPTRGAPRRAPRPRAAARSGPPAALLRLRLLLPPMRRDAPALPETKA
jgi:hypothetical protein